MIFGVAGGMADWLDLDPAVVRLVWALLIVAGGVGLLLYIIAAIVIPEEPLEGVTLAGSDAVGTDSAPMAGAPTGGASMTSGAAAREARRAARRTRRESGTGVMVFGLILVIVGAWFLVGRLLPGLDTGLLWPALLIIVGAILVVTAMSRPRGSGPA
jgi:phage shock protein C